ncbi:MAG: PfkB family carbohydrate kinase [Deinococcales bacterium]
MTRPSVLAVGLSCLDHVWRVAHFPPLASRTDASAYLVQGGGPAATGAVAVARLGVHVALVALHGEDAAGALLTAELEAAGVDVAAVRTIPGARSFVSAVLVAPDGERWIFPYRGRDLVDDPAWLQGVDVPAAAAVLVDMRHPALCASAARSARAAGVSVVADYGSLRHFEHAELADHLLVSRECAAELLGRDQPEAALERLRQHPGQVVGVTLGEEGVLLDDGEGTLHLSAPRVEAVDTTGAGDVFHGAYAAGIARGFDARQAGAYAVAVATMACRTFGARRGIPDDAGARAFVRERMPGVRLPVS